MSEELKGGAVASPDDVRAKLAEQFPAIAQMTEGMDLDNPAELEFGGKVAQHGPKEEIFPKILANTVSGCSYMKEA